MSGIDRVDRRKPFPISEVDKTKGRRVRVKYKILRGETFFIQLLTKYIRLQQDFGFNGWVRLETC